MISSIKSKINNEKKLFGLLEKTNQQNQRLKDFSYITSHNFRSSIANMLGLLTIIEEDRTNDTYFGMLQDTALKLNLAIDSINDLLNFEKDIASLERKPINLADIVNNVIVLNKKYVRDKKMNIDIDIPHDLTISTLPAYLQSILHNLISNAMKYGVTESNKKISIRAFSENDRTVLKVSDEGHGIDIKKYRNKMFQLGSRFHPDHETGHGMGLYMTKQQVEAIGGKISVDSEVNKGTTFTVIFNE
ncbi:MAG: HAMP domain-containing sensor histidine kinase [Bacteroidota bacterium]